MLNDTFELGNFNLWTDNGATDWNLSTLRYISPTHSAEALTSTNDLLSDNLNMSDASFIHISFSYWNNAIDANDDVILYYWDGTAYDSIIELGTQTASQWNNFSVAINDSQYFKSNFHIYIEGTSIDNGENLYLDNILIIKETNLNILPNITNISSSHSIIKGGETITIYANTTSNGVNDTELGTIYFYCDNTTTPNSTNTDCTGGAVLDSVYPYVLTCTFTVSQTNVNNTEYCRVYDGVSYSSIVPNVTYTTDSNSPITSLISVAGDSSPSYFDSVNDVHTEINLSGESGMSCRWSSSDVSYSSMSNGCTTSGIYSLCNVSDIASQGFTTRYISCQDSLTNEQNSTNNLDVQFYLDYTIPTTTDNSNILVHAPNYTITITESDNVDSDPTTLYCIDTIGICTPNLSIDNGGTIVFTLDNRGKNYLRYNSSDDAGNVQVVQNKTININQLPIFTSASDNATTIKGGSLVNITTVSNDSDSGQQLTLYACNSNSISSSGCGGTEYCTITGTSNLTCTFNSELDSATHTWYAFIYDETNEIAVTNFSGNYITDYTAPIITLVNPTNNSIITQDSVTFSISVDEPLSSAWYSLDNGTTNITMTNTTLLSYNYINTSIADGNYTILFWANDSYGNLGSLTGNSFSVNTTGLDVTEPTITVQSPSNNSYDLDGIVLLNITSDEDLIWTGYTNNSGIINNLGNTSLTSWNATINFSEGQQNIVFYANDSSNNQGTSFVIVYVDLNNPAVTNLSCPNVNDSENLVCTITATDVVGLDYFIVSYNATGTWVNSSQISFSGISNSTLYNLLSGNYSPGGFDFQLYVYDLAGRLNSTETDSVVVSDDTAPQINNIIYFPNTIASLDPGVNINVNSTIVEDYNISVVYLMYKNSSASEWIYLQMSNNSNLVDGSSSTIVYNASFVPETENWTIQINATDFAGNRNVSANISFEVVNDTSESITNTIPSVKSITYAQRTSNNSLGFLTMNNTGEGTIEFNVSLTSSTLGSRLSINYTGNLTENYSTFPGEIVNVTIDVNTTGLTASLHNYSVTIVSTLGTTIFEKQLNVQIADGPYLVTSIDSYSATVTKGQENVELIASVTNFGTADATDVYLYWTLPSGFSLTSGNLVRPLGNLGVWLSGSNTIKINIPSSATDANVFLIATANSSNTDSSTESKNVTIGSPQTTTETVIIQGTSGGGGLTGGGGGKELVYSKQIEVVRGEGETFEIEVNNKNSNSYLKDVTINLEGFLASYIEISPDKIDYIGPNSSGYFKIKLKAPPYKESYEEYDLKAIIVGNLADTNKISLQSYKEIQNIKLIIQQISRNESENSLSEAEKAISEMNAKGFNTLELEKLLSNAKEKLSEKRNYDSKLISDQIIQQKDTAFQANDLILNTFSALLNPKKLYLITGNAVDGEFSSQNVQNAGSVEEVLNLAKVAFERGDYNLALERAQLARYLLLLERKGNIVVFVSIYWPFILLAFAFITFGSYVGIVQHRRVSVTNKIKELNKKEIIITKKLSENQREYFNGKRSHNRYVESLAQSEVSLSNLRKQRITLRNKRIKILKPEKISEELKFERRQIESEIKKLQEEFYNKKTISDGQYKIEFAILNERLGEIEKEKTTLELINKNAKG